MASTSTCRACIRAFRLQSRLSHEAAFRTYSPSIRVPVRKALRQLSTSSATRREAQAQEELYIPQGSSLARELNKRVPSIAATYAAYGSTKELFAECAEQATYTVPQAFEKNGIIPETDSGEHLGVGKGWWYDELKLIPTFNTWAQVTFLHMYLLTVRLRLFPAPYEPEWHQHLIDHFSYAAEDKMDTLHKISMRGIRNKYLKDLYLQWRGVIAAYDEGLIRGDAVLATAVWRNIFKGQQDVDMMALAQVVSYIRRELSRLDSTPDAILTSGQWRFQHPSEEKGTVLLESRMMKESESGSG